MARANDFVDPDYDRRLAEFREQRDRMKKEMAGDMPAAPKKQMTSIQPTATPQRREFKLR